ESTEGAVILDVLSPGEFTGGPVKGEINIPVNEINMAETKIKDKNTPLYVYCLSGARSGSAVSFLKSAGYTNVVNMGGISRYSGPVVPGKK
ncbi:MAG: rhodanese-like domain-containing protein, partial [Eggerthellaceae bacterium]|nr:rhodanese-like domain-containing protein [Eggerthellaceae bacterium]